MRRSITMWGFGVWLGVLASCFSGDDDQKVPPGVQSCHDGCESQLVADCHENPGGECDALDTGVACVCWASCFSDMDEPQHGECPYHDDYLPQ